ncbi:MAG: FliM/FliN family flagellar motor switch protein [Methylotenera sp.]
MLGDHATAEMERKISDGVMLFYPQWLSDGNQFKFLVETKNKPIDIDNQNWDIHGKSESFWIAFRKDEKLKNKILKEIFELDAYANLKSTKLTDSIYQDFIDSNVKAIFNLANATDLETQKNLTIKTTYGSGALIGKISNGDLDIPVAIGGDVILAICSEFKQQIQSLKAPCKLIERKSILGNLVSKIEVTAGKVEISFSEFSNMSVGDIILLDSKVDDPFKANFSDEVHSKVQLCKLENHKAIQFIE